MKLYKSHFGLVILIGLTVSFLFSGCSAIIKGYVNEKYPPVSSEAKSIAAVQQSIQQIKSLPQVDLGAKISKSFIDTVFHQYFSQMFAKDSSLGIKGISKIQVVKFPELLLGKQELIITASLNFYLKDNKYVKNVQVDFSGRIAPSIIEDSLILRPSFQRIHIAELKLTKCIFLSNAAKLAVNALCKNFMDNINGQIKNINLKINYPPIPEKTLSSILGNDPNITVKNDYTFKLKRQLITPVLLVEPENILLISSIADNDNSSPANLNAAAVETESVDKQLIIPPPSFIIARSGKIKIVANESNTSSSLSGIDMQDSLPTTFDELYTDLDNSFRDLWTANLDTINYMDSVSVCVDLSYGVMSRIVNELFTGVKFNLTYNLNMTKVFPDQDINLGEIQKPDCSSIHLNCPLNNCSNVLSDCGSCSWWNAPCLLKYAACQTYNGIKYGACLASNAAKGTWCITQLAAGKTLCYAEIAGIFIYDNLVRPVGSFGGVANAVGPVTGEIDVTTPGGINSLGLTANIQTHIHGFGNVKFDPKGIIGNFVCSLPTSVPFDFTDICLSDTTFNINANIARKTDVGNPFLNVSISELNVPLYLKGGIIGQIIKDPQFILSCGVSILAGITASSILALSGNDTFKKYMNLVMNGSYNLKLQRDFNIYIPQIPIQIQQSQLLLNPYWGSKSLLFNNLK